MGLTLEHPMKTILALSILFSAIALPALGELTDADLDKIRLIVKDEVTKELTKELAPIKADIASIKADIGTLKRGCRTVGWAFDRR